MTKSLPSVSHALKLPAPLDAMRTECGMLGTKAPKRDTVAMNRKAATCPGCKAIVDLDPVETFGAPLSMNAYVEWASGGDSGISSLTILSAITGVSFSGRWGGGVPVDRWDFGRCSRLLEKFPELRPQLSKVAEKHPDWAGLVAHWDELEALHQRCLWTRFTKLLNEQIGRDS